MATATKTGVTSYTTPNEREVVVTRVVDASVSAGHRWSWRAGSRHRNGRRSDGWGRMRCET
jgi:hypothetical protein